MSRPSSMNHFTGPKFSRRFVLKSTLPAALFCVAAPSAWALETPDSEFLNLSRALTGHPELQATPAANFYAAMAQATPNFASDVRKLAALKGNSPKDLLAQAKAAGLETTALAIVATWYMGSISNTPNAPTFAYLDALMYTPTRDGLSPPTYCHGKPAWWAEDPPALGIAGPVAKPQTAPAQGQ